MDIRTRHYHDVAILSVNGRLDAATGPAFSQTIQEQIGAGYFRLVADLKKVDFMSSAGIKALVLAAQQARRQGGDLRIANARAHVKHILNLAGVDTIIKVYPNVVAATASYFPGPVSGELLGDRPIA
ncbi:MAG TPA: STAS domain-containing protein [Chloroflexota bacterium]|nr:STAS domain-containing protein [Chloroflexota bacterium]HUM70969.1 STAS domain-containing protein [Chloroflexota bacterium]